MLTRLFGGWGAVLIVALSLLVGAGGVVVGAKSYCTLERFNEIIDLLERENSELRDAMSSKSVAPMRQELTLVVKDRTRQSKNSLAVQNRNYLNIKRCGNGSKWVGEIGVDKYGHVIFSDPAYSIRAGAITLMAYEDKHGIDTVAKLVRRFSENNHTEYEQFICKRLGVNKNQKISLRAYMPELLKAMVAFETGLSIDEYAELVASIR